MSRSGLRRAAGRSRRIVWESAQHVDPVRTLLPRVPPDLHIGVVCVYRGRNAAVLRAALTGLTARTTVRLWSLDGDVPADLADRTAGTGPGSRFELLNRLTGTIAQDARRDALVLLDDDVRFVVGDLGRLVAAAAVAGLDLYQPAHTALSHANWKFVRRRAGIFARTTDFVEQGPVVGLSAAAQRALLPLPEDMGMGWGVEARWWSASVLADLNLGIVDAVAVRHLGPTAEGYDRAAAEAVMATELERVGLSDMRQLQRTLHGVRRPRPIRRDSSPTPLPVTAQDTDPGAVSVVVPTYNRGRRVLKAVRELLADPTVGEVIVVDDGSTDDTPLVLQALSARSDKVVAVRQPNAGAGHARQTGAERANSDIVLFLDDDVIPGPGLVSAHLAAHRADPGRLVVGSMPPVRPRRRSLHSVVNHIYADDYEICVADYVGDPDAVLEHLWAGNMSLARADALRVGVSDEVFDKLFFEDRDFGRRVHAAGIGAVFLPALAATHDHVGTLRSYLRDSFRQGEAMELLHERYPDDVPEPTARGIAGRFSPPGRLLVAAAMNSPRAVGRLGCRALLGAAYVTGALRAWETQRALVVLLRRVAQARGVGLARRTTPSSG